MWTANLCIKSCKKNRLKMSQLPPFISVFFFFCSHYLSFFFHSVSFSLTVPVSFTLECVGWAICFTWFQGGFTAINFTRALMLLFQIRSEISLPLNLWHPKIWRSSKAPEGCLTWKGFCTPNISLTSEQYEGLANYTVQDVRKAAIFQTRCSKQIIFNVSSIFQTR